VLTSQDVVSLTTIHAEMIVLVQSSPGQWDTELLLALGLSFEQVLPKLALYIMFVTFIATYLQIFKRKYEELIKIS
jgi:hypothetical protein